MTLADARPTSSPADRALDRLAAELGDAAILRDGQDFADPFRPEGFVSRAPSGAVFPRSTEQVQTVLRIARETGAAVWTHSVGRNFGYGGAEARLPSSIVLSLSRMDRILDIDDKHGVAVIEPGVTFFALDEALRSGGHHFGLSVPDLGWGSVLGNALEYGTGYTAAGEHADALCGLEVVLANGDVVRTGTGGITGSGTFHLSRRGFGPSLDGLFGQSNLGVVTRAGLWLQPEAECFVSAGVSMPREQDLSVLVDTLRPLMLDGTITSMPLIGNAFGRIASMLPRSQWAHLSGSGTEEELAPLLAASGQSMWNVRFGLAGRRVTVLAQRSIIEETFARVPGAITAFSEYAPPYTTETVPPPAQVAAGVPNLGLLRVLEAWGGIDGTGAHLDLSPACPATGEAAWEVYSLIQGRLRPLGIPTPVAVMMRRRNLIVVNMLVYDKTDQAAVAETFRAHLALIEELADKGYGVYRAHIDHADAVAAHYDFGDHSLHRTLRTIKDALDPQGILSPGKQGIWASVTPQPADLP